MTEGRSSSITDIADVRATGPLTRREALARLGAAGIAATAGPALYGCRASSGGSPKSGVTSRSASRTPNVLLIVADDMRYDHLKFMPNVRRLIADKGRAFTQARCNVPLCQPSRVGMLTGQLSKDNNEIGVGFAGTTLHDHDNCVGKWMHDAGYRCGFFGKYVNYTDTRGGIDAPAGYETWRELAGNADGYQYKVHLNRDSVTIKGRYATDYLASEASRFLQGDAPFFCVVTPTQPHAPFHPRADLAHKWLDLDWPIVDEVDVSDKPPWIQALPPLTDADKAKIRRDAIGAVQELAAVDDMVRRIIEGLAADVLNKTVIIFTSDNGVHHGEHRRRGAATKSGPYEVGLHVPLLVRGPGFAPGADITVPSLAFQDIPATLLDVGQARAALPHQAGTSLVELCGKPGAHEERILLHEIGAGYEGQTGDGITTGPGSSRGFRKLYRYPSVRANSAGPFTYEAYDLDTDPDELSNWADQPARRAERDALEAELVALRGA